MWFWDMPAPAPPPRLTLRSTDVQADSRDDPGDVESEPAAGVVAAADVVTLVPAAVVVPATADEETDEPAVDDDEAAHPAVSAPAVSSGMASSTVFTRSPILKVNWLLRRRSSLSGWISPETCRKRGWPLPVEGILSGYPVLPIEIANRLGGSK